MSKRTFGPEHRLGPPTDAVTGLLRFVDNDLQADDSDPDARRAREALATRSTTNL